MYKFISESFGIIWKYLSKHYQILKNLYHQRYIAKTYQLLHYDYISTASVFPPLGFAVLLGTFLSASSLCLKETLSLLK